MGGENGTARLRVAVNISPVQFLRDDMVEAVRRVLDETGSPPTCWNWKSPKA